MKFLLFTFLVFGACHGQYFHYPYYHLPFLQNAQLSFPFANPTPKPPPAISFYSESTKTKLKSFLQTVSSYYTLNTDDDETNRQSKNYTISYLDYFSNDGKINFEEFRELTCDFEITEEKWTNITRSDDTDGDGLISISEGFEVIINSNFTDVEQQDFLNHFSDDGKLDIFEFRQSCKTWMTEENVHWQNWLLRADSDGDGQISVIEVITSGEGGPIEIENNDEEDNSNNDADFFYAVAPRIGLEDDQEEHEGLFQLIQNYVS